MNIYFIKNLEISICVLVLGLIPIISNAQLTQLTNDPFYYFHLEWSPDGAKIACVSNNGGVRDLWIVPLNGTNPYPLNTGLNGDFYISWSPDGQHIAFDAFDNSGINCIWTIPTIGGTPLKLISNATMPSWSPDGTMIAFASGVWEYMDIYFNHTITGTITRFTTHTAGDYHPCWSPVGTELLFTSLRSGNSDIWTIPAIGGTPVPITSNPAMDDRGCWSPDGSHIAFNSDRSGNDDIWIISISDSTMNQITFNDSSDVNPEWSPDGSQIVFYSERDGNPNIWMVDVTTVGVSTDKSSINYIPNLFYLYNNYPNPFNRTTNIKYDLLENTNVVIKIHNALGQEIKTLINEYQSSGSKSVVWDGMDDYNQEVATGIYYYRITLLDVSGMNDLDKIHAVKNVECRKMLLLK